MHGRDTSFTLYSAYQKTVISHPETRFVDTSLVSGVRLFRDVTYFKKSKTRLSLDLYLPSKKYGRARAVIVFLHGGGWRSGVKSMERPLAVTLAKNGYATVCVQYRLSTEACYPAAVIDVRNALSWVRKHAGTYRYPKDKIVLAGASAGGHLAALIGTTAVKMSPAISGTETYKAIKLSAIIDIDGVLDFTHPAESRKDTVPGRPSAGAQWLGHTFAQKPEIWREASPLTHVSGSTPPTLFINSSLERFHAGRDAFVAVLNRHGIYSEVHTIPGAPHPFWLFHPWFEPTTAIILQFLAKVIPA